MKNTKKTILIIGLFTLVFFAFMNNVTGAQYSETYNIENSFVDCSKDSFYDIEYNSNDKIYFAYSDVRYALFIESNETINSLKINSTTLTSNFEDANIIAKISNNLSEIVISKSYFGNAIFLITINNHNPIQIDPFDILTTPTPTPTDNSTIPTEGVDLLLPLQTMFSSPLFWFIFSLLVILIMDYKRHPIVFVVKNGKEYKLGKYISSYHNDSLNRWENMFATTEGITIYYSDLEFNSYAQFFFKSYYQIEHMYPFLRLNELQIDRADIFKRIPKKSFKNFILKFISGLFVYTPIKSIPRKCYEALDVTKEKATSIQYLIPDIQMSSNEYRFIAKYDIDELDSKTNRFIPNHYEVLNLTYSDLLSLEKAKVKNLQVQLQEVKIINYRTIKEAEDDKRTRIELINTYEKRVLDLEYEYLQLQDRYQLSLSNLSNLKRDFNEKRFSDLEKIRDVISNQGNDIVDIISEKLKLQNIFIDDKEALKQALIEHSNTTKKEYEKLKSDYDQLKGKLEGLGFKSDKEKEEKFNPNEIIFKDTKEGIKPNVESAN